MMSPDDTIHHNKAVRDRIPEIIRDTGRRPVVRRLDEDEFLVEIERKLAEEVGEYMRDRNVDELADMLEVIYRIAEIRGAGRDGLERIRLRKRLERGAFEDNLFLVKVEP